MRVFVAADMEGVTGVAVPGHLGAGGHDYERARVWFTDDVNAAVEGAVAAGAEEVWVNDGHATMTNLLVDRLHEAARLVVGPARAVNKPLIQVTGIEHERFDACVMIGFHARAGTPGGLLAHTWVGRLVHEIRLNGRPAGEVLLNAAIVGHFGVPVVLVSGADDLGREVRADLGADLTFVEVKKTLGPSCVATLVPKRAQAMIRAATERAVRDRAKRAPTVVPPPVRIEVDFHHRDMASRAAEAGDAERDGDRRLVFVENDVPAAVRALWRCFETALREDAAFLK